MTGRNHGSFAKLNDNKSKAPDAANIGGSKSRKVGPVMSNSSYKGSVIHRSIGLQTIDRNQSIIPRFIRGMNPNQSISARMVVYQ